MDKANEAKRILVVDDDATMRLLMRHTLKKSGFLVDEAEDGLAALQSFQKNLPDMILLDVMMPGMDGFTACHKIRKLPGGAHVPILLVTGLDDIDSINKAYEAGATDFLTKPITFPLLSHRVRYVLRSSEAINNLGKSEARLAHAQAIAHVGNWEWDLILDKLYWSDEIFRIFGLRPNQIDPTFDYYVQCIHPDDRALSEHILRAKDNGQAFNFEHRVILPNDDERIVHVQGECGIGEINGSLQIIALMGTIQDITERTKNENELKVYRNHLEELVEQRTQELTQANEQLLVANQEAKDANAIKDKFVALVAHDLRSPLTGMLSALEFMATDEETPLDEEHQDIVERLIGIGKSSTQMIGDVLNIGRLQSGKITIEASEVDAKQVTQNAINHLAYLAKQKGIEIHNEVPEGITFSADKTLYGEVIQNLISNAIKFCSRGQNIRCYVPEDRPKHTIAIEDSGTGMSADLLKKLFKIEEKTSMKGTSGEEGTGFGLPFSQDIMRAHTGEISVESELGKGSTFFVYLPDNH
jgi:signal transduction histidine kinase/DNA-binding response OmpR family regulator